MTDSEIAARIDDYFLRRETDRARIFGEIAACKPGKKEAEPIVKAIGLVGARAADESLMALRLILAGIPASDEAVGRMRKAIAGIKSGTPEGASAYAAATAVRS